MKDVFLPFLILCNTIKMNKHALVFILCIVAIGVILFFVPNQKIEMFETNSNDVTVVTAFYRMKSKRSPQEYMEYAKTFMKLSAPIVLFTDKEYAPQLKALRPAHLPLNVIIREFDETETWKLYKSKWSEHYEMDHEKSYHSPEVFAVWSQKMFFVDEIAQSNPFNTSAFYWCDIGAFRDPNISPTILATFPRSDILKKISPAILMNSVESLTKEDIQSNNFQHKDRIVGGLWGGTAEACKRWKKAYQSMLEQYFSQNKFAGKDQSVMISTYIADPSLAVVVKPTVPGDKWFFQQQLLSSANAPFEKDPSYSI
jgi:hypothetical protein